jgi:hypothetical protein
MRATALSGRIIASLNDEAKLASEKASQADLARVQLEKSMEWRHLSDSQKRALCSALTPEGAWKSTILSAPEDPEAWSYASEFADELGRCSIAGGFGRNGHLGRIAFSSDVVFGVWIRFSASTNPTEPPISVEQRRRGATFLRDSLFRAGVVVAGISSQEPAGVAVPYIYVGPRLPPHAEKLRQSENTKR